jgi:hypothetical protein
VLSSCVSSRQLFEWSAHPAKDVRCLHPGCLLGVRPERVPPAPALPGSASRGTSRTGLSQLPPAPCLSSPGPHGRIENPKLAPFLCTPRKSYTAEHPTKDASPERPPQGGSRRNPPHGSSHTSAYNDPQPPRNSYTVKDFKSFRFSTYKQFLILLKTKDFKQDYSLD